MIPEFEDHELALAAELLELRFGRPMAFELAEAQLPADPPPAPPVACPALFWEVRGAQFVVCKIGDARYRGQAFDASGQPIGAIEDDEHVDLGDCIDALLRRRRECTREP